MVVLIHNKKFFAGYSNNSVAWTSVERNALQKNLYDLEALAAKLQLTDFGIRESPISATRLATTIK